MGTLPFLSAADLTIGSVGEDAVVLRAGDVDLCVIYGDPKRTAQRLLELGDDLTMSIPVEPVTLRPAPTLLPVAELVKGDRVALDRATDGGPPATESRSWATVTDLVAMVGRPGLIMVRTDAAARQNRPLRPDATVWVLRPAAAPEQGADAEVAA